MNEELKPCPFCGGEAKYHSNGFENIAVCCLKCEASTMRYFETRKKAAAAWNRRAKPEPNHC